MGRGRKDTAEGERERLTWAYELLVGHGRRDGERLDLAAAAFGSAVAGGAADSTHAKKNTHAHTQTASVCLKDRWKGHERREE